jgi:hypothetical protein
MKPPEPSEKFPHDPQHHEELGSACLRALKKNLIEAS